MISGPYGYVWSQQPMNFSYNGKNWHGGEVLGLINKLANEQGISSQHYKVLEISDNIYYSTASFDLYKLQNRYYNMDLTEPYNKPDSFTQQELTDYMSQMQYAIVPDDPGPPGLRNIIVLKQLVNYFKILGEKDFIPVQKFAMPDGNNLTVYERPGVSTLYNPVIKDGSLVVRVGSILWLNREKMGNPSIDVILTKTDGSAATVTFSGSSAEKRIGLQGVSAVKINLPPDKVSIEQTQGWTYSGGIFVRDEQYYKFVADNGFDYIYTGGAIIPNTLLGTSPAKPDVSVSYTSGTINVSYNALQDTSYVAYATQGWIWKGVTLNPLKSSISIPSADLLQLEVTSKSQMISGFPDTWGFFSCYSGNAVCFYPLSDKL